MKSEPAPVAAAWRSLPAAGTQRRAAACALLSACRVPRTRHIVLPFIPVPSLAAAVPSPAAAAAAQWYALVANAEFFCNDVQNEPLAEQLRERVR